jgi:type II secretory pathway component PulF
MAHEFDSSPEYDLMFAEERSHWQLVFEHRQRLLQTLREAELELPDGGPADWGKLRRELERALGSRDPAEFTPGLRRWLPALVMAVQSPDSLAVLRDAAPNLQDPRLAADRQIGLSTYLGIVALASFAVAVGLGTFVVPEFERLFADFGMQLPLLTEWLLIASRAIRQPWLWAVVLTAGALCLLVPGQFRPWAVLSWPMRSRNAVRYANRAAWGRFAHDVARLSETQLPIDQAIRLAALASRRPAVWQPALETCRLASRASDGLREVSELSEAEEVERLAGSEPNHDSAGTEAPPAGEPHTLYYALRYTDSPTARSALLQTYWQIHSDRRSFRAGWLQSFWGPLGIVLVGLMVGIVAVALFAPLVALIQNLV